MSTPQLPTNDKKIEPETPIDPVKEETGNSSSNNTEQTVSTEKPAVAGDQKTETNWKLRIGLLGMLSAQFASHTILVRYSRAVLHESYSPAAVVLLTEILKVTTCIVALTFFKGTAASDSVNSNEGENGGAEGGKTGMKRITQIIQNTPPPMLIPATSFFIQNLLAFVALKHLPPSVFVILSQLKIVFTTIFSVILLSNLI